MSENCVIIVAAGSGQRMKGTQPKQFISVDGAPILVHTINSFLLFDPEIKIILVLGVGHFALWEEVKSKFLSSIPVLTVLGGATRFESVKNGLQIVGDSKWVAIHDAVRPCIDKATIDRTFQSAKNHGSGIPVMPVKDSIRRIEGISSVGLDRNQFVIVQTPQTFSAEDLKKCYNQKEQSNFTDDASVFEAMGYVVNLVEGDYSNIKVTTKDDLVLVEKIIKKLHDV